VQVKGRYLQRIDETVVSDGAWAKRHRRALEDSYAAAPHFDEVEPIVRPLYEAAGAEPHLSAINRTLIDGISAVLGINTKLSWSTAYEAHGAKTERLVSICVAAGATSYLSGPSAQSYIEPEQFAAAGIDLAYMDYSGYREYAQLYPPFEHAVSILDLLFNVGIEAAPSYLQSHGSRALAAPGS
jgi:hypothetical protein